MKRAFYALSSILLVLSSCGLEGVFSPPVEVIDSSPKEASKPGDTLPKEVMKSSGASFAFMPDSAYCELVMGSAASFKKFWRTNGAILNENGENRWNCYYLTKDNRELVIVKILKNRSGKEVPYAIDVKKYNGEPMPKNVRNEFIRTGHMMSAHGIYIGMSQDYVMTIYTDQRFMQQTIGDTTCLTYRPKEKDSEFYKNYPFGSVVVRYKFVDDHLRRLEYLIDPVILEEKE